MKTRFSFLLALLLAALSGAAQAQSFTSLAAGAWTAGGTWTPMGTMDTFPGQTPNNGAVTINLAGTFTGTAPANNISSLTIANAGAITVALSMTSTLRITGNLTVQPGMGMGNLLQVGDGMNPFTLEVNGTTDLGATATNRIQVRAGATLVLNGLLTGSGLIQVDNGGTVIFGPSFNMGTIPGANFAVINGRLQTNGSLGLNGTLTVANTGTVNLTGILTVNPNGKLVLNNNVVATFLGTGQLQAAGASATVALGNNFNGGNLPGNRFVSPFNGTLLSNSTTALTSALTIGNTGVLIVDQPMSINSGVVLTLANTSANSLSGSSVLAPVAGGGATVVLGAGFNGGTIPAVQFANPFNGSLNTSGPLNLAGTLVIGNPTTQAILNLGGTLTVNNAGSLGILETAANSITGGSLQGQSAAATIGLGAGANGAQVAGSATTFANPFNGTLQLNGGGMTLNQPLVMGPSSVLALPAAAGTANDLQLQNTLTLNQTTAAGISGGAAIRVNNADARVILPNSSVFGGSVPSDRFGNSGAPPLGIISNGTLELGGSLQLTAPLTVGGNSRLQINGNDSLTVGGGQVLRISSTDPNALTGSGRLQAQDATATVMIDNTAFSGNIPGNRFGNPYRGTLHIGGAMSLTSNLVMGTPNAGPIPNAVLNLAGNLTVQSPANLTLNFNGTQLQSLPGAGAIVGGGVAPQVNVGPSIFGTGAIPFGAPANLANFAGIVQVGDANQVTANTTLGPNTIFRLNTGATVTVNNGFTLTFQNAAANSFTGNGRLQGASATAVVQFNAGANGGVVPGNLLGSYNTLPAPAFAFNGTLQTLGAMSLTGWVTMGTLSVLNIGGDLNLAGAGSLTLGQTAACLTSLPGTANITGTAGSRLELLTGAFGGYVPTSRIPPSYAGQLVIADNMRFGQNGGCFAASPYNSGALIVLQAAPTGTTTGVIVESDYGIRLTNTSSNALTGTGFFQGQSGTSSITLANNFGNRLFPGTNFANPFTGYLTIEGAMNMSGGLTMGTASTMNLVNGPLTINPSASLTLNGTNAGALTGSGQVQGTNVTSQLTLGNGFNGGTLPVANMVNPFNGRLNIVGPMNMNQNYAIGQTGMLDLRANLTIGAAQGLFLTNNTANSLIGAGRFVASSADSRVQLGNGFNGGIVPGAPFTGFNGRVSINGALSLGSAMLMGQNGTFDFGGGANTFTLGINELRVAAVLAPSSQAFIVTNTTGTLTLTRAMPPNNEYFFPIGTTATAYTPITIINRGAADSSFSARVSQGLTNPNAEVLNRVNLEWWVNQGNLPGAKAVDVILHWLAQNETAAFVRNQARVAAFTPPAYRLGQPGVPGTVGANFTRRDTLNFRLNNTPLIVYSAPVVLPPGPIAPTISTILPASVVASDEPFTVSIFGSNYLPSSSVIVTTAGISRLSPTTTNVISVGRIDAVIPGFARVSPRTLTITVTNNTAAPTTNARITVTPAPQPTLTSITPSSTTASGQPFRAVLTGTNFFRTSSQVFVTDSADRFTLPARVLAATTASQAVIEIPAELNITRATNIVSFVNGDGQSAQLRLPVGNGPAPFISGITPTSTTAGVSGLTLTIRGVNFFRGARILFADREITPAVLTATSAVLQIPADLLVNPGFPRVQIINGDGQNFGVAFAIITPVPLGPPPVITSVTPNTTTASLQPFTVTVRGRGFLTGNNSIITTTFGGSGVVLDSTTILGFVPALSTSGTFGIGITNIDGQTTSATFSVGLPLPAPTLSSVTPGTTMATQRAFAVTVVGTNFRDGVTAFFRTAAGTLIPLGISAVSPTSLRLNVPDAANVFGDYQLIILNPDGRSVSTVFRISGVSVQQLEPIPGVSAFPNPVSELLTVEAPFDRPTPVTISLTNLLGQRVMLLNERATGGTFRRQLNISGLPTGSYTVEVSDGTRRTLLNVVKY